MEVISELTIVFIILMNMSLSVSGSLRSCIKKVALQGIAAGILTLMAVESFQAKTFAFAGLIILLKGFVFPHFMVKAVTETGERKEIDPLIGYPASLILCLSAFAVSSWMGAKLPLPETGVFYIIPASLATIFTGFLLIITRAKAIMHVLGYLVIENGIYIFGLALFVEQPLMVELAILLDAFVAVFVMGLAIFHISKEFTHTDTNRMAELSDIYRKTK